MSISAGTQLMIWAIKGHPVIPDPTSMPPGLVLAGKIISTLVLLAFIVTVARLGRRLPVSKQVVILSLMALLSPVISPVSWLHAYAIAFVAFVVLWREAIRGVSNVQLGLLTASSIMTGSYVWLGFTLRVRHSVPNAAVHLLVLVVAVALAFYDLARIRLDQPKVQ